MQLPDQYFKDLLDQMLEGCQIIGLDWRYLYINDQAAQHGRREKSELLGQRMMEVYPGIEDTPLFEVLARCMATRTAVRMPNEFVYPDGAKAWFELRVQPVPEGLFIMSLDITAHKRAEEEHKLFRMLLDQSNDAIEVLDPETGRFLDVNEKGCLDLGYSREEFLALSVFDIDPMLDRSSFTRDGQDLRKSGSLLWESIHRRKNGSTFPVEVNLKHVQLDRNYLVAVVRDISERKRAEAELHLQSAALNSADNAIVITDRSGAIEWANPAFTRLTGYAFAEVIGKNPRLLKSGRHEPAFYQLLWEAILSGRVWRGETINRRKNGSFYTENQTITPVMDESGAITHFVAIKEDISAQLQLQTQLHQAQKMEALGQLAGGVAHDFNNLITIIQGYSSLLLKGLPANDPLRGSAEEIQQAGERAEVLVRQLLVFSRRQEITPQVLDLNQLVTGVEKMLRRLIGEDITLEVKLAPEPGRIKADPGQLEQVLVNLVVNARDAMPEGGRLDIETVEVDLELEHAGRLGLEEAGCCAVLVVRDTGTGMDQEVQKRIFEPFFTTKGPDKGTGLGLATVYGIVKQHQGSIQVRSQLGKGTVFEIYLPQVAAGEAARGQERRSGAMLRGAETLLLVEDEVGVRRVLAFSLRELGYKVLEAGDGEKAIQVCEEYQGRIELLLTDMVMPKINGNVTAERVSALRPGIKVLYMSGYADRAGRRASDLESVGNFIQKPFSVEVLARQVRQVLNTRTEAAECLSTEEEQDAR